MRPRRARRRNAKYSPATFQFARRRGALQIGACAGFAALALAFAAALPGRAAEELPAPVQRRRHQAVHLLDLHRHGHDDDAALRPAGRRLLVHLLGEGLPLLLLQREGPDLDRRCPRTNLRRVAEGEAVDFTGRGVSDVGGPAQDRGPRRPRPAPRGAGSGCGSMSRSASPSTTTRPTSSRGRPAPERPSLPDEAR